ncbi:hypothetical protein C8J56DRAFT_897247 [Mycena floridula]|nr:hypothetical protein C8J56DRAFT_897247 [Mycena floridula]
MRRDTYFDIGKPRDEEPEEEEAEYWEPSKVESFIRSAVLGLMRGLGGFEDGGAMGEREVHDTVQFPPSLSDENSDRLTYVRPPRRSVHPDLCADTRGCCLSSGVGSIAFREQLGAQIYACQADDLINGRLLSMPEFGQSKLLTHGLFLRCNNNNSRQKVPVVKEGLWGHVVGSFNKGNEGSDTESLRSESPSRSESPLPDPASLRSGSRSSTIDSQTSIGSLRSTASGWSRPDPSAHFILLSISVIYPISSTNPPSYPGVREEKRVGEGKPRKEEPEEEGRVFLGTE